MRQTIDQRFQKDLESIQQISIIPSLLDVIAQSTGMGFVAVARVTEDTWMACSVKDSIAFGLQPGEELKIKTTICNEIRGHLQPVVIDDVLEDPEFCNHHTPRLYGFRSYISVPLIKKDGSFFGTLCAIDPRPNKLKSSAAPEMFVLFAELISFHLSVVEKLEKANQGLLQEQSLHQQSRNEHSISSKILELKVEERTMELVEKNKELQKMNEELQAFSYVASHDLQEPLRKIRFYTDKVLLNEGDQLSEAGKSDLKKVIGSASRMHLLVKDLISFPQLTITQTAQESVDLSQLLEEVKVDLAEEISLNKATIDIGSMCSVTGIRFQLRQLFSNLIGNSLKFVRPGVPTVITIRSEIIPANRLAPIGVKDEGVYCHLHISDNGIGFDQKYADKIFQLFQKLDGKDKYQGTGIGLTIVKKIVDHHKGFIQANGKPGEGVSFDIYLPHR